MTTSPRLLAAALAAALLAAHPAVCAPVHPVPVEGQAAVAPFFGRLSSLDSRTPVPPVRILVLGDSHTAGESWTGRLRDLFQERFGGVSRGTIAPGKPMRYYRPHRLRAGHTRGWSVRNSRKGAPGPYGLTGFRLVGRTSGEFAWAETLSPGTFDRAVVEVVGGPGYGTLVARIDGRRVGRLATFSTRLEPLFIPVETGGRPARRLDLSLVGDGPVEILSVTLESGSAGIVLDSHGLVGATVGVIDAWDPELVRRELGERPPSLIVLAYGTNEGFDPTFDPAAYEAQFRRSLDLLRERAPGASILVVGPPDGALASVNRRRKPKKTEWVTPPFLAQVREIQRRVALAESCSYWDWSAAMGGPSAIHEWRAASPPLAGSDRIHLTDEGYAASADTLFDSLLRAYDTWRDIRASR